MKTALLLAALFTVQISFAQIPKPLKNTYVNDFAHLLTADQITALNQQIFDIEKQSDVQFAIVLVPKLPDSMAIEDFSLLVGRKWHVGRHKNGLVYVAAIQNRKQRIEVADSLSALFTSEKCADILNTMKPSFKAGEYNAGLQTLVSGVRDALAVVQQPVPQQPQTAVPAVEEPGTGTMVLGFVIVFGILALFIFLIYLLIRSMVGRRNNITYNNPANNAGYNNAGGYYNNPPPGYYPQRRSSFWGSFFAGAATGYAARTIQDDLANNQQNNSYGNQPSNDTSNNNDSDNRPSNWGNWGSSGDSSSSNDSSSSDNNDSSSSQDSSGFSGSDDSGSGGGASSDW